MKRISMTRNELLTDDLLQKIVHLKQQHWNYNLSSQKEWIKCNLELDDIHVYIEENSVLLSYLNLVNIKVKFDNHESLMIGVGNVCTDHQYLGQGLASLLVKYVNNYLIALSKGGVLLCINTMTGFYNRCGWNKVNVDQEMYIGKKVYKNIAMVFNTQVNKCIKNLYISKNF